MVRIAFTLDCRDREAISWVTTTGGIGGGDIHDLMIESVERGYGLVNRVFADEVFDQKVQAYVAMLAAKPAATLTLLKQLFYRTDGLGFEAAVETGADTNALARTGQDFQRGSADFLNKR